MICRTTSYILQYTHTYKHCDILTRDTNFTQHIKLLPSQRHFPDPFSRACTYDGQILADNPKFVEWPLGESSPTWQCHRDCQFLFPWQVSDQSLWQFICPSSQSPSTTTTPVLNNSELGLSLKSLQTATHTWGLLPHAVIKPTAFCCTHKNNTRTTGSEWHQHTYNVITQPDNL